MDASGFEYIGWIPCVNGHLDFGLTNVGIKGGFTTPDLQDSNIISKNFSLSDQIDSHHRAIILQSKVDWRDSESYNQSIGHFRVFVSAQVTPSEDMDQRELVGDALIYPLCAEPEDKEAIAAINAHRIAHEIFPSNVKDKFDQASSIFSSNSKVIGIKNDCFVASINFKVRPNGLTFLRFNPGSSELDERSKFLIARQIFYYIKYSVHSHRHHENEQDSLTTITKLDSDSALRLVCQLKRELTNLGRIQKIDNKISLTSNTDGIISYTKSLIGSLHQDGLLSDADAEREEKRFNNTSSSFVSLNEKIKRAEERIELYKQKSKVWIGFGIIFSWSLAGYSLNVPDDFKFEISKKYALIVPFLILFSAIFSYVSLKNYYSYIGRVSNLPSLYSLDYRKSWVKVLFFAILFCAALSYEIF